MPGDTVLPACDPWEDGHRAGRTGRPFANPHPVRDWRHWFWAIGWDNGREELERPI